MIVWLKHTVTPKRDFHWPKATKWFLSQLLFFCSCTLWWDCSPIVSSFTVTNLIFNFNYYNKYKHIVIYSLPQSKFKTDSNRVNNVYIYIYIYNFISFRVKKWNLKIVVHCHAGTIKLENCKRAKRTEIWTLEGQYFKLYVKFIAINFTQSLLY